MRTRLKLKPGQRGTKKMLEAYGEQLVCVRYRYDAERGKRFKTVELIVDEAVWQPRPRRPKGETIVGVRVKWGESQLSYLVKQAGGKWNRERKVWELRYDQALALGLESRIVDDAASIVRKSVSSNNR